ncbi:MAG: MFS transporter [Acetobacteraceae bacterium]
MASTDVPTEAAQDDYPALRSRKLRLLIPAVVAVGFMMEQLDSTIITTAIPDIAQSLQVTPLQMNLAITSYILSLAVFIPISGWIADRYGSRRVFAAAMLIFTLGSMLCGLADSLPVMVATRVLQGFGGAMMTPVGRLVLIRAFPRSQLVTAMTYMTVPAVIGPTMGPLLGGFITMYANWRWIFYVNVPIGLLGFVLVLRYVDDVRVKAQGRFDVKGFLIAGFSLALLQLTLENVGHPMVGPMAMAGLFVGSIVLMFAYVRYARHVGDPALDLSLFSIRSFRVSTMAGGISRIGVNAVPFMLPLLFQIGFGLSPLQSGGLTFITSLGTLAVKPISASMLRAPGVSRAADQQWRGLHHRHRRLRPGAAEHAALAGVPACAGVRHRAQHPVHDVEHADLFRHAQQQAEPQHQPGWRDPAAHRLVRRVDRGRRCWG